MNNKQLLMAAINELNMIHFLGADIERASSIKAIMKKVADEYPTNVEERKEEK